MMFVFDQWSWNNDRKPADVLLAQLPAASDRYNFMLIDHGLAFTGSSWTFRDLLSRIDQTTDAIRPAFAHQLTTFPEMARAAQNLRSQAPSLITAAFRELNSLPDVGGDDLCALKSFLWVRGDLIERLVEHAWNDTEGRRSIPPRL
jgi:hypothetical protein